MLKMAFQLHYAARTLSNQCCIFIVSQYIYIYCYAFFKFNWYSDSLWKVKGHVNIFISWFCYPKMCNRFKKNKLGYTNLGTFLQNILQFHNRRVLLKCQLHKLHKDGATNRCRGHMLPWDLITLLIKHSGKSQIPKVGWQMWFSIFVWGCWCTGQIIDYFLLEWQVLKTSVRCQCNWMMESIEWWCHYTLCTNHAAVSVGAAA